MIIRGMNESDFEQIRKIHEKYYSEEFEFPDFVSNYLGSFVAIDNDTIISAGGVRSLAESVLITNKDLPVRQRREALYKMLEVSSYITRKFSYNELHAFIQDDVWEDHLKKAGFRNTKGHALIINV